MVRCPKTLNEAWYMIASTSCLHMRTHRAMPYPKIYHRISEQYGNASALCLSLRLRMNQPIIFTVLPPSGFAYKKAKQSPPAQ